MSKYSLRNKRAFKAHNTLPQSIIRPTNETTVEKQDIISKTFRKIVRARSSRNCWFLPWTPQRIRVPAVISENIITCMILPRLRSYRRSSFFGGPPLLSFRDIRRLKRCDQFPCDDCITGLDDVITVA